VNINPKVSIVIPVYNGSDYLREAIDSALAQTYCNIEIVVINDGSQDGGKTERIALSYGDKIRYFAKKNGGVASALNAAIEKMTGDYLSWLSHDDLYYPEKVETQVQALADMDRSRSILYGDYAVFSDNAADIKEIRLPTVPPTQFKYFITVNNILHGCTLLIPKVAFDECGGFNEALRSTQDYDLWFRMAENFRFIHIPCMLVKARIHPEQGSIKMKSTALTECNSLLADFVENLSETDMQSATSKSVNLSYAEIAENFRQRGFYGAERRAADLAIKNIFRGSFIDALKSIELLSRCRFTDRMRLLLNRIRR
jgi:glycosyltransferase involved in cell wall biosynthesis